MVQTSVQQKSSSNNREKWKWTKNKRSNELTKCIHIVSEGDAQCQTGSLWISICAQQWTMSPYYFIYFMHFFFFFFSFSLFHFTIQSIYVRILVHVTAQPRQRQQQSSSTYYYYYVNEVSSSSSSSNRPLYRRSAQFYSTRIQTDEMISRNDYNAYSRRYFMLAKLPCHLPLLVVCIFVYKCVCVYGTHWRDGRGGKWNGATSKI